MQIEVFYTHFFKTFFFPNHADSTFIYISTIQQCGKKQWFIQSQGNHNASIPFFLHSFWVYSFYFFKILLPTFAIVFIIFIDSFSFFHFSIAYFFIRAYRVGTKHLYNCIILILESTVIHFIHSLSVSHIKMNCIKRKIMIVKQMRKRYHFFVFNILDG